MWLLMAPDTYHRLVHIRGWTSQRYRDWLITGLTASSLSTTHTLHIRRAPPGAGPSPGL
jgi:hypothetical protein